MNYNNIPVLISKEEIKKMVSRIRLEILADLKLEPNNELNFITVLEGARRFSSELRKELFFQNSNLFNKINNYEVKISSYRGTTSKRLKLKKPIKEDISGKKIIILEDIVDTGKTIQFLTNYLIQEKRVFDIKIASLLSKPSKRKENIKINYLGKEIPDVFVVGYGLDYNGKYRRLDYIGIIESK